MSPRRFGRPGLIGMAARTAVVAGTATAVSGNVARRQGARAQEAQNQEAQEAQPQQTEQAPPQAAPQTAAPAPAAADNGLLDQLNQLSQLHNAGVLSDEEFTAAKAKLLA